MGVIYNLGNDYSLIIKGVDKGSAIVLRDCLDYLQEIHRQLDDRSFHISINHEPTDHISRVIKTVINEVITLNYTRDSITKFLYNEFLCISGLLHVCQNTQRGMPPPRQPIISVCGSFLNPVSKFLDYYLQPAFTAIASAIAFSR